MKKRYLIALVLSFVVLAGMDGCENGPGDDPTTTTTIEEEPGTTTTSISGGSLDTIESIDENMVSLPGGTFEMGCSDGDADCTDDEYPQHTVTISAFKVSAYEVTQGQWEAVMGSNPSHFKSCGSNCPVEVVSWDDVQDFITALNLQTGKSYRMCTEAEWEYAARATTATRYYCGDNESCLDDSGWYYENAGSTTHPVGQKEPTVWGLYDMSGNVWEWVSDLYGIVYYSESPSIDPQGPETGASRVLRGGSWDDDASLCRSSERDGKYPSYGFYFLGFRLCHP